MKIDKAIAGRTLMVVVLVVALVAVDQWVKVWIKTHMTLHESITVFSWFKIAFIENSGMAWGLKLGSKWVLSIIRIVLIVWIAMYTVRLVREREKWGYLVCMALIIAGAMGNIIDGMFYGLIFTESTPWTVAEMVPWGTGYAGFMMGKVVDMLYFPLIVTQWPQWVPLIGGGDFVFFSPIFNIADSSISIGVVVLLLFYRRTLMQRKGMKNEERSCEPNSEQSLL